MEILNVIDKRMVCIYVQSMLRYDIACTLYPLVIDCLWSHPEFIINAYYDGGCSVLSIAIIPAEQVLNTCHLFDGDTLISGGSSTYKGSTLYGGAVHLHNPLRVMHFISLTNTPLKVNSYDTTQ